MTGLEGNQSAPLLPIEVPIEMPIEVEREIIVCHACHLRQFITRNNNCRRCKTSFKPQPQRPPPIIEVKDNRSDVYIDRLREAICLVLKVLRMTHNLSQRDLAQSLGLPRTYISRVETGRVNPSFKQLERYSGALGVSMYTFMLMVEFVAK